MNRQFAIVVAFSIYCVAFGSIRYFLTEDAWGFLHHNLWLGSIPLMVAGLVRWREFSGWWLTICGIVWLIFLPNAPYIVTDLIHMRDISTLPWFDLILIFHFALAGLLCGSLSLSWMHSAVSKYIGKMKAIFVSISAIILSGVGMVMGRDLRLKSEEMFVEPGQIFFETWQNLDTTAVTKAAVYAATFGVFHLVFIGLTNNHGEKSNR